jgi:hypothetical protein
MIAIIAWPWGATLSAIEFSADSVRVDQRFPIAKGRARPDRAGRFWTWSRTATALVSPEFNEEEEREDRGDDAAFPLALSALPPRRLNPGERLFLATSSALPRRGILLERLCRFRC